MLEKFAGEHRFGGEAIETGRIDVDARDLGAGSRERARHHASHAARRSRDHGHAARKQLLFGHGAYLLRAR